MKILFIGCVKFSYDSLKALIKNKTNIVGICTLKESKFNNDFCDLSSLAKQHNIPFKYTEDINESSNTNWIKSLEPDIIFCFGWSKLLKQDLIDIPKLGVLGYHPAYLPKNRGRHPIIWALVLGLKETASTFFFINKFADSGDILNQKVIKITYEDTASTLYEKMTETAIKQINSFLPDLQNNCYKKIPQDNRLSNTWRKRKKIDGLIDWRMDAENIRNLIRGLTKPYCGASFIYEGSEYKIWEAEAVPDFFENINIEPGKVLEIKDEEIIVKCGKGAIRILNIEPNIIQVIEVGFYL